MARATGGHLPVGGIAQAAAAVAAHRINHAGEMFQVVLQAPEATAGEHRLGRALRARRCRRLGQHRVSL